MKAVVVEIKGRHVAALASDGCVNKIRNNNYTVGQVIEMKKQAERKPAKIVAWASSAAAAIVLISVSAWAYFTPYTYVSIDVNPSIEYSVNRFDRVLSASAVDSDGSEILKNLDLNNKTIDEAIKATVGKIKKAGYFEGTDPGGIEIATSSDDQQKSENLAKELKTTALQETEGTVSPVEVDAISVAHQRVLDAKKLGTTPGKLNLVQKLQASAQDPNSIDIKEWLNKPVKTILKAIKENKSAASKSKTEKKTESGSSSSSQASKANSKAAGSVQQSSKAHEKSSQSQSNKKKAKTSNSSSGTPKVTDEENNGNSGTTSNSNVSSPNTSAPNTANEDSTHLQAAEGTNSSANNENQGNANSNKDKNSNNGNQDNANSNADKNANNKGNGNGNGKSK